MSEPETFKAEWPRLTAKVHDRWPKLTDEDIDSIDGDLDRLVEKVNARYGWTRTEVLEELSRLLEPAQRGEEDIPAGEPKLGEHVERGGTRRGA